MLFFLISCAPQRTDVINYVNYIELQAVAVLKRVCSMYPYECRTGKSLQSESREVSALLVRLLQEKSEAAGARVISYASADLQYAPEIAPGMLVRQQAHALVEARHSMFSHPLPSVVCFPKTRTSLSSNRGGRSLDCDVCSDQAKRERHPPQ